MRRTLAILAALALAAPSLAAPVEMGSLVIEQASASASIGRSTTSAAYLTIRNRGTETDRLLDAASPAAERVGLHVSLMEGGTMRMLAVDRLDIPPGETVTMRPGAGLHLMLEGLREPLRDGAGVPMTLRFERAGTVDLVAEVVPIGGHRH
ncbi:MAG TPA: copper chaperone PCu(A)C [Geminicoccaceae bacterium]|nr:copper chaperone PCu(A)C [Geminicoccus sp.]HMU52422.1 copper chaperone PCu(A)C [Geminicoccaceae bacterium]